MGDLTPFIPQESETVKRIYAWHKAMGDAEPERGYLGASIVGHECDRFLWYTFRNCVQRDFSGRLYRLFETGDLAEARFVAELRGIGCEVHEVDPATGKQFEVLALGGHFSGHMDGCAVGIPEAPATWHVLEFKTHNAKSFAKLKKEGVRASKPMHYAQMMVYMGHTGMSRALYLAANKDTDELYAERIRYDAAEFRRLMDRAERIIRAQQPPERITGRRDDFRCRFCDAKDLCWGTGEVAVPLPGKTCRTCCHATPEIDQDGAEARWSCAAINDFNLPEELQRTACHRHLILPGLVNFAEATDAGDGWIEFTNCSDGAVWRHGDGSGGTWSTEELIAGGGPLEGRKEAPCPDFGISDDLSLIDRYPWQDSEMIWNGKPEDMGDALESEADIGPHIQPTASEKTDAWAAYEYGDHGLLAVIYLADNHAAIWRGKE